MNGYGQSLTSGLRLGAVCALAMSILMAAGWRGGAHASPYPQAQAVSVGVLTFQDDSGANLPAELVQRLSLQLRQKLNTSYKDLVARAVAPGGEGGPPGASSVEQLVALGRLGGFKFVVRGGVLDLTSEAAGDEMQVSVQLYAEVISVESGTVTTVRVEGTGAQKGSGGGPLRVDAASLASSEFPTTSFGLAVSSSVEQLAPLIYNSVTGQRSDVAQAAGAVDAATEVEATTAAEEEEIQQLLSQAEALLAAPGSISSASAASLGTSVRALKDALAAKASLLEKGKPTAEADQNITNRKAELQTTLAGITAEAAAAPSGAEAQTSGAKKNFLATVGEYLGEATNILQKIQEIRNTFRSVSEDASQYGAAQPAAGTETYPTEEATGQVSGVVTEDGAPVEGVTVTDEVSGASATTDASGSYFLKGLLTGELAKLVLSKGGKQIGWGKIDIMRAKTGVADFYINPGAGLRSGARIIPAGVLVKAPKLMPGMKMGVLQGSVEDAQGRPVARALVQLKGLGWARTDSQGRYAFYGVPPGAHVLTVRAPGLKVFADQVQVAATGDTRSRIKLSPVLAPSVRDSLIVQSAGTTLRGVVRDSKGTPVEGARIIVLQAGQAVSAVTGRDGNFELKGLKPASYRVVISKPGFEASSQDVGLRPGRVTQGDFRITRASGFVADLIEAQRGRQGELRGDVRWAGGGPIAGAHVEIKPLDRAGPVIKAGANPRGEYAVRVPEGRYEINVRHGTQAMSKTAAVKAGGAAREDFAFRRIDFAAVGAALGRDRTAGRQAGPPPPTGSIFGRVADAKRGTPLAGASVSIEGGGVRRDVRTDRQGGFSLADLPPDRYRVSARYRGFAGVSHDVVVRAAAQTQHDFMLQPEGAVRERAPAIIGTFRLPPRSAEVSRGQITGRVVNARSGAPVAGATVAVAGQRPVVTDSQGVFTVINLTPGDYRINVTMSGFAGGSESVTVRAGQTTGANFRLAPSPLRQIRRLP